MPEWLGGAIAGALVSVPLSFVFGRLAARKARFDTREDEAVRSILDGILAAQSAFNSFTVPKSHRPTREIATRVHRGWLGLEEIAKASLLLHDQDGELARWGYEVRVAVEEFVRRDELEQYLTASPAMKATWNDFAWAMPPDEIVGWLWNINNVAIELLRSDRPLIRRIAHQARTKRAPRSEKSN
jgi:hypothetical protein